MPKRLRLTTEICLAPVARQKDVRASRNPVRLASQRSDSEFGADLAKPEARKHSEDDSMSTLKRMALTVGSLAAALLAGAASFRIT